ncbi:MULTISPECIES: hypothetical protein [Streptomyces]|uniref:Uncharacterized protein n=2 Tax=Streptomyces TaxID=1883 RepID=A0ABT9LQN1_STRGD|nr:MULTISPECIES: hypothetical protein [Streptomyces]MDP9685829.1 hypothetical protein [Streptomyces griseoviridis]GGS77482.1 hypothetical protein GCM10010240_08160 [Streptomyces griseoviridis]GGU14885.1 hypothetical protein GCM10010259_01360 [Streptomyces daghestanicus]GHI35118.1 hypothetical protein Sdagh_68480 [Streptomyces daghestanicus]
MEQSGTPSLLKGAVQDLATGVASALSSGGHGPVSGDLSPAAAGADGFAPAAVRVLGADFLLPHVLAGTRPDAAELALFRQAVEAYPPRADAAPTVLWSHWAMRRTLRVLAPDTADGTTAEPRADWLELADWRTLTHQLSVLASLALPGADSAVARVAGKRNLDLARGFVRAVRRRDWLQAAGAGRWLSLLDGVPDTLGLPAGLDFVELMADGDPQVGLQVRAARRLATGALV